MIQMIDLRDLENIFWLITFFLLGISIGSFLNVVIYRLPKEIPFATGFSKCPSCNKRLKALDLIPLLSYLFLKRKCRTCGIKISPRYFLVELLTGLVYCSLFIKFGLIPEFFFFSFLMSVLIAVFFIDYDEMIIPDELVITGIIGGVVLYFFSTLYVFFYFGDMIWWGQFLGAAIGSGAMLTMLLMGRIIYNADAMGMGDVKIFIPIGLFLGWKMTIICILLSVVAGGLIGAVILAIRRDRKAIMPFGPFIVVGTYLTIMAGHEILAWYIAGLR